MEFQYTIALLNLNDDSKQFMFYCGLFTGIKKLLIYFPLATTFDQLVE